MEWEAGVVVIFGVRLVFCDDCCRKLHETARQLHDEAEGRKKATSVAHLDWMDQHGRRD